VFRHLLHTSTAAKEKVRELIIGWLTQNFFWMAMAHDCSILPEPTMGKYFCMLHSVTYNSLSRLQGFPVRKSDEWLQSFRVKFKHSILQG
jgi:hypothetical protein